MDIRMRSRNQNHRSLGTVVFNDYWNTTDMQYLLNLHNYYRGNTSEGLVTNDGTGNGKYPISSNMNSVFWDEALAALAQNHSNTCVYGHNANRNTQFYNFEKYATYKYPNNIQIGENIAAAYTSETVSPQYALLILADAWFNEHVDWHYQKYESATINGAGHFSQIAWAETRYIGCGYTTCPGSSMYYLVCDYYPPGNYIGELPYVNGTNYAKCDPDRTTHVNGLCAGCMSSSYTVNSSATKANDCTEGPVGNGDGTETTTTKTNEPTKDGNVNDAGWRWKSCITIGIILGLAHF